MNARTPTALILSTLLAVVGCSDSDSDDGDDTPTVMPPVTGEPPEPGPPGSGGNDSGVVTGIIDRMGRPGVSTALIRTDDDEDAYNASGDPSDWSQFRDPMLERMRLIDGLDGVMGNLVTGSAEQLTDLLIDDRLQIDTSMDQCDAYLALEIGFPGCGGRTLERDVIDDTLRHLVSQNMPVSDLADMNDASLPNEWPFLAPPFPAEAN